MARLADRHVERLEVKTEDGDGDGPSRKQETFLRETLGFYRKTIGKP